MPTLLEILVILLVVLLVFTSGRLADLGDGLGRLIHGDADTADPEAPGERPRDPEAPETPDR